MEVLLFSLVHLQHLLSQSQACRLGGQMYTLTLFMFDTFRCIRVPAVVPQHMVSTAGVPFNNLFCSQVLLRWALVSAAAVLLAACLLSCWIGISILVADGVSVVDTLPSCVWMMTVPAVLACMATNLGRRLWSALWVSSHSLLPSLPTLLSCPGAVLYCQTLQRTEAGTMRFFGVVERKA